MVMVHTYCTYVGGIQAHSVYKPESPDFIHAPDLTAALESLNPSAKDYIDIN